MRRLLQRWRALTALERMLLRRAVAASIVARIALVVIPWKRLVEGKAPAKEGPRMRPPHPPSAPFDSLRSLRAGSSPPARNRGGRRTLDETESRGVQAGCENRALAGPEAIALVRWAVGVSARRVPFQTCLSSALVARDLLGRLGVQSTLEVGAYFDEHGAIAFHAVVTSGGVMVCGERPMTVLASIATS